MPSFWQSATNRVIARARLEEGARQEGGDGLEGSLSDGPRRRRGATARAGSNLRGIYRSVKLGGPGTLILTSSLLLPVPGAEAEPQEEVELDPEDSREDD